MTPFTMVAIIVIASLIASVVRTSIKERARAGGALPTEELRVLRADMDQLKAQVQELRGRVDDHEVLVDEAVSTYRKGSALRQGQGGT